MRHGLAMLCCAVVLVALPAGAQVFVDPFDGTGLDPAKWTRSGGGTVDVAGGFATSSAACGDQFPYVVAVTNPFPASGDFVAEVGFRYPTPRDGGNGFGNPDFALGGPGFGIWVWQDYCCGGFRAACGNLIVPISAAPDTAYHRYEWRYLSGVYHLYVDGTLLASDPSPRRPTGFFFGHPPFSYCPWTTQEIDFVRIVAGGPTTVRTTSWGRLKAGYR